MSQRVLNTRFFTDKLSQARAWKVKELSTREPRILAKAMMKRQEGRILLMSPEQHIDLNLDDILDLRYDETNEKFFVYTADSMLEIRRLR